MADWSIGSAFGALSTQWQRLTNSTPTPPPPKPPPPPAPAVPKWGSSGTSSFEPSKEQQNSIEVMANGRRPMGAPPTAAAQEQANSIEVMANGRRPMGAPPTASAQEQANSIEVMANGRRPMGAPAKPEPSTWDTVKGWLGF